MVEPKGVAYVVQGEELNATCNALSSLTTHTAWLKVTAAADTLKTHFNYVLSIIRSYIPMDSRAAVMNASMLCSVQDGLEISTGQILTLKDATFDKAGTYDCVVSANEIQDMRTNGTLVVRVMGK